MADPQTNKATAQAFYDLMFNQSKPRAAIQQYAGPDYRQHNPHVGDGKQAFIDCFEWPIGRRTQRARPSAAPTHQTCRRWWHALA